MAEHHLVKPRARDAWRLIDGVPCSSADTGADTGAGVALWVRAAVANSSSPER